MLYAFRFSILSNGLTLIEWRDIVTVIFQDILHIVHGMTASVLVSLQSAMLISIYIPIILNIVHTLHLMEYCINSFKEVISLLLVDNCLLSKHLITSILV